MAMHGQVFDRPHTVYMTKIRLAQLPLHCIIKNFAILYGGYGVLISWLSPPMKINDTQCTRKARSLAKQDMTNIQ